MENPSGESSVRSESSAKLGDALVPLALCLAYLIIGLFFLRPNLGEPDAYRAAVSAIRYIEEGVYSSYWYHPLSMYIFVAVTRLAFAFNWNQTTVFNVVAVLFGSFSVWPFYQLLRRLVNWQTAAFASIAFMTAPVFIRFSTYLTHEIIGLAFGLWAVHLLERALARQGRVEAIAFGFFCAATWTVRPNTAIFIALPLLVLFFFGSRHMRPAIIVRFMLFASLGLLGCLFAIYRPALIAHLTSKFGSFFFVFYDFGLFLGETTSVAIVTLTPVLVALAAIGLITLIIERKVLLTLIAVSWFSAAYIFYIGMHCRDRYFVVMLPPCLLLCFAGADEIDNRVEWMRGRFSHATKASALALLLAFSLGPSIPNLIHLRTANDDEAAARMIGEKVGSNLLFTTSLEPLVQYYNRENPPETIYLVREYSPGKIKVDLDGLQVAQKRLMEGRPVFATDEIIRNLHFLGIQVNAVQVGEYKMLRLFRITAIKVDRSSIIGFEAK